MQVGRICGSPPRSLAGPACSAADRRVAQVDVLDELLEHRLHLAWRQRRILAGPGPAQAVLRQRPHVARIDAAAAERLDERDAVAVLVVRHQVDVGGDQRAQVLAEGEVDRRAVVERADAHVQDVAGRLRRLLREAVHQVRVKLALRQHAGAAGGEPQQVARAVLVDRQERVEHRGHQDRAARVRLAGLVELGGIGLVLDPLLLPDRTCRSRRAARRACRARGRTASPAGRAGSRSRRSPRVLAI